MKRDRKKVLKLELDYAGTGYYGRRQIPLPREPSLRGLQVDIFADETIEADSGSLDPSSTGIPQIQLCGSPAALKRLGTFLIAVGENRSPVGFLSHFDLRDGAGNLSAHLIVRHKKQAAARTVQVK
jgi:hypothetical protein